MITSFEVGAIFKIIDEASPALAKILKQVRALQVDLDKAKASLTSFGVLTAGIGSAAGETQALANAWREVATASAAATRNIGAATAVNRRALAAASGGAIFGGGGGRGGGRRPSIFGRGGHRSNGIHVSSVGTHIPGGHAYFRGGGNAGLAFGGLAADAIYQGSELEKEAFLAWWHSGMANTPGSKNQIRELIQKATAESGFSFKDVGEAAENIFRLRKGTPGNGLPIAPELLRAGATEALIKGTSLKESTKSMIEMAQMMGINDPEQLKAMAPVIGFLSTANPASLPQMTRSASYSIPTLSNALGMNAAQVLFQNTAIARAGATGTKSGTWVEHAFDRALPPDPHTMNAQSYSRRMWAMRKAGLIDKDGKSTIMAPDGSVDGDKMLETARNHLGLLPRAIRNAVEKAVFGEQGARGFELMSNPNVMAQQRALHKEMPDFVPKYNAFLGDFQGNSTIQNARTAYADFNNVMADLGDKVLPAVNGALNNFKEGLDFINGLIPKPKRDENGKSEADKWHVGASALTGAGIGGTLGALFGFGGGAVPGAAIGGGIGAIYGVAQGINSMYEASGPAVQPLNDVAGAISADGNQAQMAAGGLQTLGAAIHNLLSAIGSVPAVNGAFPGGASKMNFLQGPKTGGAARVINAMVHMRKQFVGTMTASIVEDAAGPIQGMVYPDATRRQSRNDHSHAVA